MRKAEGTELGTRLKQLAKAAGYTAETLAEVLGCSPSAVWAWWAGRNEPSVESLRAYAEAVQVSVDYLVGHQARPSLEEWRLRTADLIRSGIDPAQALAAVIGKPLAPEEQRLLTGQGEALRALLDLHSEGRWEQLDQEQRLLVLEMIRVMARDRRPDAPAPE